MSEDLPPRITTHHTYFPSPFPAAPSYIVHLTKLTNTVFIWLASAAPSSSDTTAPPPKPSSTRLAAEWAVAMPARPVSFLLNQGSGAHVRDRAVISTAVYRSTGEAEPIAQRLARKFPGYQIHLSLDLPQDSGPRDPTASRSLMMVEKKLVEWIQKLDKGV